MERKPVSSSAIVSIGHDPQTNILEVEMTGGKTYTYPNVPKEAAHEFINNPVEGSHGKHLARHIRPNYSTAVK